MWETYLLPARGNFSLRKIVLSLLAVLLSALFMATVNTATTHAADASWQDDGSILYGGKTYRATSPTPTGVNAPQGASVFVARENETSPEASVLFIEPNTDTTKEMAVKVAEYTVSNTGEYTNPRPPTPITASLEAKPEAKNKTQCDVAGVGWIICVTSRFIAGGMDNIFKIIASYLEVKPISTDTSSGLFKAWSVALGIANLMFILAFLFIIYAHLTSYGMSNYDIKKMIPKLIVAAILVNISYYICAIAVDISNVLGYSVQQALIDIRTSLPDPTGSLDFNWRNVTEFVLSGGTIAAGAFAAKAAFLSGAAGGSISGLAFLLFPILVSGALAVLIALLILAARQALITVLIVVAPLAFVAYLLPNTEKWFEKWRELFMTMLLVFPLFSLLFGGSQLASYIVIQNTDQISIVIFAMFIQVAPLVMTPFLIKFSGSLLGRLAGMVNDPKRGIVDRARGWATDRAEVQRGKGYAAAQKGGGTRFQRSAFRRELDKKNREGWKKTGELAGAAGWAHDSRGHRHHSAHHELDDVQKAGDSLSTAHYEKRRSTDANLRRYVAMQNRNEDIAKNYQIKRDADWQEMKSGDYAENANNQFAPVMSAAAIARVQETSINDQAQGYRKGTAEAMQKIEYAKAVVASNDLAKLAGGIDTQGGADSARASAVNVLKKAKLESTSEGKSLYEYFNLSSGDRQKLAKGIAVTGRSDDGTARTFTAADSEYVRMAAIEQQVTYGTLEERQELILKTGQGNELYKYRELVSDAMVKGNIGQMANYMGGKTIDDVRGGRLSGTADLLRAAATSIAKGKLSPEQLLNQDKTSMETIVEAVKQVANGQIHLSDEYAMSLPVELSRLFEGADRAMTDPRINVRLGERANSMRELRNLGLNGTPYTSPLSSGTTGPVPPFGSDPEP